MPIKIANDLPATKILESENIFVMTEERAIHQDIRPLNILIVNLMPTKIATETQLMRLLSNSPLQVNVELVQMATHTAKNTDQAHLDTFYKTFEEVRKKKYDGMIITGAPVENLDFEEVDYWPELCALMRWSTSHVHSTLHICWGAQAGLFLHHDIHKFPLPRKLSGVYPHKPCQTNHPLLRGFDDTFYMPHSRYTEVLATDIAERRQLQILADSPEAGVAIVATKDGRQVYVFGHCEYDRDTLLGEYRRDVGRGINPDIPAHYFPDDDPEATPLQTWRGHANLLFSNWLNYFVYQQTPFDIESI